MDFSLTAEQESFRDDIARFVDDEILPQAATIDRTDEFPHELIQSMADQGYLGMPFPRTDGGLGLDYHAYAEGIAEISRGSGGVGTIIAAHTSLAGTMIYRFGSTEQRDQYLKPLASGTDIGAFALSEAEAGSDVPAMETRARRTNDGYRLSGEKLWTSNGSVADTIVTFAKTSPSAGSKGISAFILRPHEDEGVSVLRTEQKMGDRGCPAAALSFSDVSIPQSRRIGEEGVGFKQALSTLNGGRITIAARGVGLARAAYQIFIQSCEESPSQRKQHAIANASMKLRTAELLLHEAAAEREEQRALIESAAMAKLYASEVSRDVSGTAIDLLGYEGITSQSALERIYRDAKLNEIYEGTSEILRNTIAHQVLERCA